MMHFSAARSSVPNCLVFVLGLLAFSSSGMAQHTLFFTDFRQLGRLDSPPSLGPLEPTISTLTTIPIAGLAELPGGELLQIGDRIHRVAPETLELTELADIDILCRDVSSDADGNIWCVNHTSLHCLSATTYELALSVEHPGLNFRAVASLGTRLFAIALQADNYPAGHFLIEIQPATGGVSMLGTLDLPPPPDDSRFFEVSGMDFDDNGDLWLGLPLYFPAVTLPPPPEGYLTRVLDPLGGAVVQPAQALEGTSTPTPIVIGGPTLVAVPAVGPAGLSALVGLLVFSALSLIARRP